jgi:uncharacterized protein YjiS (DUF1127 family)
MATAIRRWVQSHRYRVVVRQLKALSPADLRALGIARSQINYLALEVSRVENTQTRRTIIALLAVAGLIGLWGFQ